MSAERAITSSQSGATIRSYRVSTANFLPLFFFLFFSFLLPLMSVILLLKGLKGLKPNAGACKPFMTRAGALSVRVFSTALYHFAFTRVKAI